MEPVNEYKCETCNYQAHSEYRWKKHLETFKHKNNGVSHNKAVKMYFEPVCDICGEEFARADSLKRHKIYKHMTEEEKQNLAFKCDLCDKSFYINSLYQQHCKSQKHIKKTLENIK